jgi:rRNA maturation RNase YbeY
MDITFQTQNTEMPPIMKGIIRNWIKDTALEYGKHAGSIAYIFCNDITILGINRQYLQHDYYTDIITFDYSNGIVISGDIFISIETVLSNSEQYNTPFEEELHRAIIHGILHLCGINDKTPAERTIMEDNENVALSKLPLGALKKFTHKQ